RQSARLVRGRPAGRRPQSRGGSFRGRCGATRPTLPRPLPRPLRRDPHRSRLPYGDLRLGRRPVIARRQPPVPPAHPNAPTLTGEPSPSSRQPGRNPRPGRPALMARLHLNQAEAHALPRDGAGCTRAVAKADFWAEEIKPEDDPPRLYWLNRGGGRIAGGGTAGTRPRGRSRRRPGENGGHADSGT